MEWFVLRVGNLLVGYEEGEAAIEAAILGPKLKTLGRILAAFTGVDLSPEIDGKPASMWRALVIAEGSVLPFGTAKSGCRAYLAVSMRIDFPVVMSSRSIHTRFNPAGNERALAKGDVIKKKEPSYQPYRPENIWEKNKSAYPTCRIREVGPASFNHLICFMQALSQPGLHQAWQKLLFCKQQFIGYFPWDVPLEGWGRSTPY